MKVSDQELDAILVLQLGVAWAGEGGEEPRLGWWRTELCSEYGGEDLFRRLLPHTWRWATLEAVRQAATRHDAALRAEAHDPDAIYSLYRLGFEVDERLHERLAELERTEPVPADALPGLSAVVSAEEQRRWDSAAFEAWLSGFGAVEHEATSVGRRLRDVAGESPVERARRLASALLPLADAYPLPHVRRGGS